MIQQLYCNEPVQPNLSVLHRHSELLILSVLVLLSGCRPTQNIAEERATRYWKQIRASESCVNLTNVDVDDWARMIAECQASFREMLECNNQEEVLSFFVEKFGTEGPLADYQWAACAPDILLPMYYPDPLSSHDAHSHPYMTLVADTQLKASKVISKRLSRDRAFLQRYYYFVLWNGGFIGRPDGEFAKTISQAELVCNRIGGDHGDETFWWNARKGILLMYATNQEHLIAGNRIEDFRNGIRGWCKWLLHGELGSVTLDKSGIRWLGVASEQSSATSEELPSIKIPNKPFPDWDLEHSPPWTLLGTLSTG